MSSSSDPVSSVVSWGTLLAANTVGWLSGDFAGQIVAFASILAFGAVAVYTRVTKAIDNRRVARELLPTRIRLEAERLEAEARALHEAEHGGSRHESGTGDHAACGALPTPKAKLEMEAQA